MADQLALGSPHFRMNSLFRLMWRVSGNDLPFSPRLKPLFTKCNAGLLFLYGGTRGVPSPAMSPSSPMLRDCLLPVQPAGVLVRIDFMGFLAPMPFSAISITCFSTGIQRCSCSYTCFYAVFKVARFQCFCVFFFGYRLHR